jgi:hypothetical protein
MHEFQPAYKSIRPTTMTMYGTVPIPPSAHAADRPSCALAWRPDVSSRRPGPHSHCNLSFLPSFCGSRGHCVALDPGLVTPHVMQRTIEDCQTLLRRQSISLVRQDGHFPRIRRDSHATATSGVKVAQHQRLDLDRGVITKNQNDRHRALPRLFLCSAETCG